MYRSTNLLHCPFGYTLFGYTPRRLKGNEVDQDRLTVNFTVAEKSNGILDIIPSNMYAGR